MAANACPALCALAALVFAPGLSLAQELVLLSAEQSRPVLGAEDAFIARMTPLDRAARMKTDREVSTVEYLRFAAADARNWTGDERARVQAAFGKVRAGLVNVTVPFPEKVRVIKTSGAESKNAAYTRGDAIILPEPVLQLQGDGLAYLLAHELFHLITRANPGLAETLYAAIGFMPCGQVILPEGLAGSLITNPDEPAEAYCINVGVDGETKAVMPILLSRYPAYESSQGGEYIDYVDFRLYVVEGQWAGTRFVNVNEVTGFFEQVGENTEYVIHPEEILADNFVRLVLGGPEIRSPAILAKMQETLARFQGLPAPPARE